MESGSSSGRGHDAPVPPEPSDQPRRRTRLIRPWEDHGGSPRFKLTVVQSPVIGPAYEADPLRRISVQPPLVVRLTVQDETGREVDNSEDIPFLVGAVNLLTETGKPADTLLPTPTLPADAPSVLQPPEQQADHRMPSAPSLRGASRPLRMLAGSISTNAQRYRDLDGVNRTFLVFPEISVRTVGHYLLEILLFRIPFGTTSSSSLAEVVTSQVLQIVPISDYVSPEPTDLSIHLQRQGAGLLAP